MDIEKMIEQLRYLADTPSYTAFHDAKEREIICDQCEADFCYDKQQDAHWCMYEALSRAATALSTLQAENEKLRAKLKQVKRERDSALKDLERLCRDDVGPCEMAICELCAYNSGVQCSSSDRQICDGYNVFNWKWRGPQEEDWHGTSNIERLRKV